MRHSQENIIEADLPLSDSEHIVEIGRRMLNKTLKYQDTDLGVISAMLLDLNPEGAEGFLDKILEIDPGASDETKAEALFETLKKHSKNTVLHSKDTAKIMERIKGNSAFAHMNLGVLAKAIEHHDFGKLGMRAPTLNRGHSKFTAHQAAEKEGHSYLGYLINKVLCFDPLSGRIALTHHLKYQTRNGQLEIVGYPKADFLLYCRQNGLRPELTAEDQLASFVDVYSALTDTRRPSDPYRMNRKPRSVGNEHFYSDQEMAGRSERALETMDNKIFNDIYYQKGDGAALYHAFKEAIWRADIQTRRQLMAA